MTAQTRKNFWFSPAPWILGAVLSLVAAVAAVQLLNARIPALDVKIEFSREEALQAAAELQHRRFPDLTTSREATHFARDQMLQTYIELEGGGLEAFRKLIDDPNFAPFAWNLRRFTPQQQEEFRASYTPTGEPLSFNYEMPQDAEGSALEAEAARTLAEQEALAFIGERFNGYAPFDAKQVTQPNGRVDHTFTYQHKSLALGEARPRLNLVVRGDRVTRIQPFNHIPHEFYMRFGEMRQLNQLISQYSSYAMAILFVIGGVIGGGIWLYRKHQLKWLTGAKLALVVTVGVSAAMLASLPARWMSYQTTDSVASFIQKQAQEVGLYLVFATAIFATIFAVAEGLSRKAFAGHPRLFSFYTKASAASPQALGRIGGGYIWTGFFLLYAIGFILLMQQLGGWSPRDLGVDPNILSSWRPALGPIFQALQAATWEECLFRAIPLASAMLIGRHFGKEKLFVITALILQAVIFAGAHANYPQLPGYSRLLELLIPSLVFGLVFLRFGLVPCITAHFLYDLVLMSSPLFTAEGDGLFIDRVLVVAAGLTPLGILLAARLRVGRWQTMPAEAYNGKPPPGEGDAVVDDSAPASELNLKALQLPTRFAWPLLGLGLVLVMTSLAMKKPSPLDEFSASKAEVIAYADQLMAERGVVPSDGWRRAAVIEDVAHEQKRYVWHEASDTDSGRKLFYQLLGSYLDQPYWTVSYHKFDGPVETRQETWKVWLTPSGELVSIARTLPEAEAGAELSREEAIALAKKRIAENGWTDPAKLEVTTASENQRPERLDWHIEFADRQAYEYENSYAFIWFDIAGDQVVAHGRSITVPEAHKRENAEKTSAKTPWKIATSVCLAGLIIVALVGFFYRRRNRGQFMILAPLPWCLLISAAFLLGSGLWAHTSILAFQTTVSLEAQWIGAIVALAIGAMFIALIALLALQPVYNTRPTQNHLRRDLLWGFSLALVFSGVQSLIWLTLPSQDIPLAMTAAWGSDLPWLATLAKSVQGLLSGFMLLALCTGMAYFLRGRLTLLLVAVLALGWALAGALKSWHFAADLANNVVLLTLGGLLVYLSIRREYGLALSFIGFFTALKALEILQAQYPGAVVHSTLALLTMLAVTTALVWHWYRAPRPEPDGQRAQ